MKTADDILKPYIDVEQWQGEQQEWMYLGPEHVQEVKEIINDALDEAYNEGFGQAENEMNKV